MLFRDFLDFRQRLLVFPELSKHYNLFGSIFLQGSHEDILQMSDSRLVSVLILIHFLLEFFFYVLKFVMKFIDIPHRFISSFYVLQKYFLFARGLFDLYNAIFFKAL